MRVTSKGQVTIPQNVSENMAVILIDSCIITDLADPGSAWFEWSAATLERLDQNNTMVIH